MQELLRELGFTEGEIKVYLALARLGKTSTGSIMESANISSSKIYLILDKLIRKGLVTYVIEENIKKFQVAPALAIKDYIDKERQKLNSLEVESDSFIKQMNNLMKYNAIETAQIYKGYKGVEIAFTKLIDEMGSGEPNLFFSRSKDEFEEKVLDFFNRIKEKRLKKKIHSWGVAHPSLRKEFQNTIGDKYWKVRYSDLLPPTPLTIGKNSILLTLWGEEPICFEIKSERMVSDYKKYFQEIWEIAQK